jgi:hypothetical protein
MRTRKALERLAAVGQPLVADADSLLDSGEEELILERIFASGSAREPFRRRRRRWLRVALVVALTGAVAAVLSLALSGGRPSTLADGRHHPPLHLGLSRKTFTLAGYRFRLPAAFKRSSTACHVWQPKPGTPITVTHWFRLEASADGGCLVAVITAGGSPVPSGAQPVAVGAYNGFLATQGAQETLYVQLPVAEGNRYLVLVADGLSPDQLIAIAQSGLPGPPEPGQTCTTDCG